MHFDCQKMGKLQSHTLFTGVRCTLTVKKWVNSRVFSIFRAARISRRRCAAIGGLWRPQPTPTDSIRPYSTLPHRYSTTTIFPTTTQPPSNPDNHREPQPIHNRPSTACRTRTCKALLQPSNNHAPTILRVESKSDSDSTIPHSRSSNLCNIQPATHPQIQRRIMGYNLEKGNASSSVLRRLYPHLYRVWS